jgi:hypothetical protein
VTTGGDATVVPDVLQCHLRGEQVLSGLRAGVARRRPERAGEGGALSTHIESGSTILLDTSP